MVAEGLTKAEATLDVMRFYYAQAIALTEQVDAQSGQPANATERRRHARMSREMIRLRELVGRAAAKAAPYVHPRMSYVSDDDVDDDFVPIGSASLARNALSSPADPDAMPPYHASELRRRRNSLRTAFDHAHADDFAATLTINPLEMSRVWTALLF